MEKEALIQLVQQAQQSDANAISVLFAQYKDMVYSIAMRETKDRALSDDIVQETFVEVILKINDLKNPASFPAWLKILTYHQCTRYYKKKETVHETVAMENDDGLSIFDMVEEENATYIPDEALDQKEFKETILEMMETLPDAQRAALHMFYYEEMPLKVIAKIQGVSINTANTRLNRGRLAMKNSIEDYEKKHGVRLHSILFFPFFRWLFKGSKKAMPDKSAKQVADTISARTGVCVTTAKAGAVSVTVATTAGKNAATVASVKTAATSVIAKAAAGIVAASIVISTPFVLSNVQKKQEEENTPISIVGAQEDYLDANTLVEEVASTEEVVAFPNSPMEYYAPVFVQYQNLLSHSYPIDPETWDIQGPDFSTDLTSQLLFLHCFYQNENSMYVRRNDAHVYYAFEDLNEDGIDELFIGVGDSIEHVYIHSLFSFNGVEPIRLVSEDSLGERAYMTVYEDNTFMIYGSGGAAYSCIQHFKLLTNSLVPEVINEYRWEDTECYRIDANGSRTDISKEEYTAVMRYEGIPVKKLDWQEMLVDKIENSMPSDGNKLQDYLDFSKSWGIRKLISSTEEMTVEQVFDFAFDEDGTFTCFFYNQYSDFLLGFYGTYIFENNYLTLSFVKEGEMTNQYTYYFEPQAKTLTVISESGLWYDTKGTTYLLTNDEWYPTSQDVISGAEMAIAMEGKEMGAG